MPSQTIGGNTFGIKIQLKPSLAKAGLLQETAKKGPSQETGLGNRGHLKDLKDTKLILIEHAHPLII